MYITHTTRFGKILRIPTQKYFSMTDEELEYLEEVEGTSLVAEDIFYAPIDTKSTFDDDIINLDEY